MSDSRVVSGGHPSGDRPTVEPAAGVERSPTVDTFAGAKRYARVAALRNDSVNPALLGMKRVCSEDSVRRGPEALDPDCLLAAKAADCVSKLRMTKTVQRQIAKLAAQRGWRNVGQGWEGAETELQLAGWTRKRRVIVLRRRIDKDSSTLLSQAQSDDERAPSLVEILSPDRTIYEYTALVTSSDAELLTLASLYRSRADVENILDELKNHGGWGGFTTQDLARTRPMARITALVYDWWSLLVACGHRASCPSG